MDVTGGVVVLLIGAAVLFGSSLSRRENSKKKPRPAHERVPERCVVEVGTGLISELSAGESSPFLTALPVLRLRWLERGLQFPPTRFFDSSKLETDSYLLRLDGRTVATKTVKSGKVLVLGGENAELPSGDEFEYEGLAGVWTDYEAAAPFRDKGYLVLETRDVFLGQLSTVARRELHTLGNWERFFRQPPGSNLERFREQVIAKLDEGQSLHPIDYAVFWFETHNSLKDFVSPDEQGTNELTAALIYQNLGQSLRQAVNKRMKPQHLEKLSQALLEIWELDEEAREIIMRRARVWNLHDNEQAVDSVVKLLVHGSDYDQRENPNRRLALLVSTLPFPVRNRIINALMEGLSSEDFGALVSEMAAVQTCHGLNEHALTDPLERERLRVVREFIEWRRNLLRPRVVNVWPGQAERVCKKRPRELALWMRHLWFFEDPLAAFQGYVAQRQDVSQTLLKFSKKRPTRTLSGPEKIAVFLQCLSAETATKLRRELSRLTLPPISAPDTLTAERLLVCEELVYRTRCLSDFGPSQN